MNRRTFSKAITMGLGAAVGSALPAAALRKLKIGYTSLTWNAVPKTPENLERALKDFADLGFPKFETFCEILEYFDSKGTMQAMIDRYQVPLCAGYCSLNMTDPTLRKENLEKVIRFAKVTRKYGGTFVVLAANSVKREGYDFQAARPTLIAGLNDYSKAIADLGLSSGLHQHTGTAIETPAETYAIMHAVDTRYVKFAPDVGQLQKGGADPYQVVKDFLPITTHMHLKDFSGGEWFVGYCPLGQGKVNLKGILDLMEDSGHDCDVMIELDRAPETPVTALETARISKAYLQKLGYTFRT
jgi:inosose dehydratase